MIQSDTPHHESGDDHIPLSVKLSDSERIRKRDQILPRGIYPGTYQKGQMPVKSSYYVPAAKTKKSKTKSKTKLKAKPKAKRKAIRAAGPEIAELLIGEMPKELGAQEERAYWERMLLKSYYYLYGEGWGQWASLIPWLDRSEIPSKARQIGCDYAWGWTERRRFIQEYSRNWSLADLDYLIDRYPDRQINNHKQSFYVSDKPFNEIQRIAQALRLPTKRSIEMLAKHASKLNDRI